MPARRKASVGDWLALLMPAPLYIAARRMLDALMGRTLAPQTAALLSQAVILVFSAGVYGRLCRHTQTKPPQPPGKSLLRCGIAGLALGAITAGLSALMHAQTADRSWQTALLLCLLAPVSEEILFRGFVYQAGERIGGGRAALLLSAALFAAAHGTPMKALAALPAGLVLGCARLREGRLAAPILLHILANTAVFLLQGRL